MRVSETCYKGLGKPDGISHPLRWSLVSSSTQREKLNASSRELEPGPRWAAEERGGLGLSFNLASVSSPVALPFVLKLHGHLPPWAPRKFLGVPGGFRSR